MRKKKIKKGRPLTDKEKAYIDARFEGNTQTEAADIAYDTKYPNRMGYALEKKPQIQAGMQMMMELGGITEQKLVYKHAQLLEALNPDGNPEWETQRKTLDMAYKLRGDYAPEKHITATVKKDDFLDDLAKKAEE